MKDLILEVYKSPLTVFSLKEIALLIGETDEERLKSKVNYHVRKGKFLNIRRGIYAKEQFNPLELANKLFTPSYISLETVLQQTGIIFQHYETIFALSYLSREIKILEFTIRYRKIKDQILSSPLGLQQEGGYSIASPERAFLDALYIYRTYYFDKVDLLNRGLVYLLIEEVYKSKKLEKQAKKILGD